MGIKIRKTTGRPHQWLLWRVLVSAGLDIHHMEESKLQWLPVALPLLRCPQNSSGRGLREGKCVLQPLRAGGGAQPRGYLIALKSKTKSCLQSFKSIWPNNPTYGDLPKEDGSRILKGYLHYRAYCTNIYNSQDTSASLNGRMDREDMRTYLCIISWRHFAKWDNHTEKDEYCIIITYMCNLKKAKAYRKGES